MKIAAISDTHGRDGWGVPQCDVFIHAGDITAGGSLEESLLWIDGIAEKVFYVNPQAHMLIVPGNHDKAFEYELPSILQHIASRPHLQRMHILINEGVEIEGNTYWGSPNTPPFFDWHFMSTEEELSEIYKSMPDKVDVLITHGPPKAILDPGHDGSQAGSIVLKDAVFSRNIKHHVFGHLHAAGGKDAIFVMKSRSAGITTMFQLPPTHFHNVAAVDEVYRLVRQPIIIEL